jgi:hypothetical protein
MIDAVDFIQRNPLTCSCAVPAAVISITDGHRDNSPSWTALYRRRQIGHRPGIRQSLWTDRVLFGIQCIDQFKGCSASCRSLKKYRREN